MARHNTKGNNKAEEKPPGCQVGACQAASKYKCPTCALRYCSVACCKLHKATPCVKPDGPTTQAGCQKRARTDQEDFFPVPSSLARRHHAREAQAAAQAAHAAEAEEDDDFPVLTEEMRKTLCESKCIRTALADPTLCSLLADIDGHAHRGAKLKEALRDYPDFQGFVDRMLLEVGALKYEDGRLVFRDVSS